MNLHITPEYAPDILSPCRRAMSGLSCAGNTRLLPGSGCWVASCCARDAPGCHSGVQR